MPSRRYTHSTPNTASSVTACLARRLRTTPTTIAGGASSTSSALISRVAPLSTLAIEGLDDARRDHDHDHDERRSHDPGFRFRCPERQQQRDPEQHARDYLLPLGRFGDALDRERDDDRAQQQAIALPATLARRVPVTLARRVVAGCSLRIVPAERQRDQREEASTASAVRSPTSRAVSFSSTIASAACGGTWALSRAVFEFGVGDERARRPTSSGRGLWI